jgi:hypothetical protein
MCALRSNRSIKEGERADIKSARSFSICAGDMAINRRLFSSSIDLFSSCTDGAGGVSRVRAVWTEVFL